MFAIFVVIVEMILSHRSRKSTKNPLPGIAKQGYFYIGIKGVGLFWHKGAESLGFRGQLTLDFPPLKPIVKELLTNLPKEEVSDPTFNNNIRNICRKAGITEAVKVFKAGKEVEGEKWEFVSSHTARRSFATNLYLRGADLYSISQMMGHASVEMTQNYLCCGLREQSAQVMEYFK